MKLLLALPDHAETISQYYRANHGPEFPHPELFKPQTVAQLLRDEEIAIVAASRDGQLLGCGLAWPGTWNSSIEIGSLSVDEVRDRGAIAKALFEALRRFGLKKFGIVYFRAANETAFKRGRELGAMCWGFRPDPGSRDLGDSELIMGLIDQAGDLPRIAPPQNAITQTRFARRLAEGLSSIDDEFPYPKNFPVGSPRGTGSTVISGRIWPTYHSRGNYITIENTAGRYPSEIIREFVDKVREKGVNDVRLALPVNQEDAFFELVELGFTPVAYLPGWFLRGPHRFDCVHLVAGLPRIPRNGGTTFIERAISKIVRDLTP